MEYKNQLIKTLQDVLDFMAPMAGGSVPATTDEEYDQWVGWIQRKQQEYARRAFWRRTLTRETITLDGETTVLPDRFYLPNGIFLLDVDGTDFTDPDNPKVTVEMDNDPASANFGKWQMRFTDEQDNQSATIWYFANPPVPTDPDDILLLPGDMIGYAALEEYFTTTGAVGSQDDMAQKAENRFGEYLSIEVLPAKSELITFNRNSENRIEKFRNYYSRNRYSGR